MALCGWLVGKMQQLAHTANREEDLEVDLILRDLKQLNIKQAWKPFAHEKLAYVTTTVNMHLIINVIFSL